MLGSIILTDRPSLSVFGGNEALRGFLVVGFYSHVLCLVQLFAVIRLAESYSEKLYRLMDSRRLTLHFLPLVLHFITRGAVRGVMLRDTEQAGIKPPNLAIALYSATIVLFLVQSVNPYCRF